MKTPYNSKICYRLVECTILSDDNATVCQQCEKHNKKSNYIIAIKQKQTCEPAAKYAPITKTNPHRVKLALQNERLKCSQLESKLWHMRTQLQEDSMLLHSNLSDDLVNILSMANKITPFMNLFWQYFLGVQEVCDTIPW